MPEAHDALVPRSYPRLDAPCPEVASVVTAADIVDALRQDQFRVHYQPIVCLRTGRVIGAEALARWDHPERGLQPPSLFVPVAESEGLIGDLTTSVVAQALADLASWRDRRHDVFVAVNLSIRDIEDNDLPPRLARLCETHAVAPEHVHLEITESIDVSDWRVVTDSMQRLRMQGFSLSIDDFGTGHSSLLRLMRLPCPVLKIDRAFVLDLASSPLAATILSAIVQLAKRLGLRVVAEGIEDAVTLRLVREFGCDWAQGYYFGRPMPASVFADHLAASPGRLD